MEICSVVKERQITFFVGNNIDPESILYETSPSNNDSIMCYLNMYNNYMKLKKEILGVEEEEKKWG